MIHRDWIIGHGSNALSDKDKAEQILLQSGGHLAGICNFPGGQLPGISSFLKIPGGQLAGIPTKVTGVNLPERGVNQEWNGGSMVAGIISQLVDRPEDVKLGQDRWRAILNLVRNRF
jgi:hypothetical protein